MKNHHTFTATKILLCTAGLLISVKLNAATSSSGNFTVNSSGNETGDLTVQGEAHFLQDLDFGTTGTSLSAGLLHYSENGTTYTISLSATRPSTRFLWQDNGVGVLSNKMLLGPDNTLSLFNGSGVAGIVLSPNAGVITLTGSGSGLRLADGTVLSSATSLRSASLFTTSGTVAATATTDGKVDFPNGITVTGKGAWLTNGNSFGAKTTFGSTDNYDIGFLTNNTERLTILAGGNVGVGTTTPSSKLTVAGNIGLTSAGSTITSAAKELLLEETGDKFGTVRLRLQNRNGVNGALIEQAGKYDLVDFVFRSLSSQRNIRYEARAQYAFTSAPEFQFGAAGDPGFVVGDNASVFRKGNVGIGTGSPEAKLHSVSTTEQLRLGYDASNYLSATIGNTGNATFNLAGTTPKFIFNQDVTVLGTITCNGIISGNGSALSGMTPTQVGLGNVENTKLSTWTGSPNITTLV